MTRHQICARIKDGNIPAENMAMIELLTRVPYCNVKTAMWLRMFGLRGPHHNTSEDAGQPVVLNER